MPGSFIAKNRDQGPKNTFNWALLNNNLWSRLQRTLFNIYMNTHTMYTYIFPPTVMNKCMTTYLKREFRCLKWSLCFINPCFFVDFRGQSVPADRRDVLKTRWKDGRMNGQMSGRTERWRFLLLWEIRSTGMLGGRGGIWDTHLPKRTPLHFKGDIWTFFPLFSRFNLLHLSPNLGRSGNSTFSSDDVFELCFLSIKVFRS